MHLPHRHRMEIVAALGSLYLLLLLAQLGLRLRVFPGTLTFVSALLLLGQPYALLRLIDHFRPVPGRVLWTAIGIAGLGLLALIVLPYPRPAAFIITTAVYFGAFQAYAAWAFFSESRQRVGVTRWRLWFAGAGTTLAAALVLAEGLGWLLGVRLAWPLYALLAVIMSAGYWMGLAPPRPILRWWQQREFVHLLRRTAERWPHEREDHLADDLNEAATRGVTASATAVLLGRDELTVYASSEPAWEELRLKPELGLVGIALGGVEPVVGPPDECERPLNTLAAGNVVAVIPIVRGAHRWGALVVAERRESVFLPEDLALLGVLCRHAADVLDHARLLHEEKDRRPHTADARELLHRI